MMTLRCTRRLLRYFEEKPHPDVGAGTVDCLLGDWYANLVWYGSTAMALCVNGPTRYAIVIPLEDCETTHTLYIRVAQRTYDAIRRVGAPQIVAGRVLDEYRGGVSIEPTNNRSILGTMNDLAKHLIWHLEQRLRSGPVRDPADLDDDLNVIPHRPLNWSSARERLLAACHTASA